MTEHDPTGPAAYRWPDLSHVSRCPNCGGWRYLACAICPPTDTEIWETDERTGAA